jgi:hypothetical protein
MPTSCIDLRAAEPDDLSVCLNIAVFFQTACVDLALPRALIGAIAASGVDVRVSGYPCASEDVEKSQGG